MHCYAVGDKKATIPALRRMGLDQKRDRAKADYFGTLAHGMSDYVLQGDPPIPVTMRRSARARRVTLRISSLDGRVTVTLPRSARERDAIAFVEEKADWIRRHLADQPASTAIDFGAQVPIDGALRTIARGEGKQVRLTADALLVPGSAETVGRRLRGWIKTYARLQLADFADGYALKLGRGYSGLSLRDTRSRWGSCTSAGRLMFSWRLIMAPTDVQAYVAAHEVAHLAEMNHSPAFWRIVEDLYGPYAESRGWLRKNGAKLHTYRFED